MPAYNTLYFFLYDSKCSLQSQNEMIYVETVETPDLTSSSNYIMTQDSDMTIYFVRLISTTTKNYLITHFVSSCDNLSHKKNSWNRNKQFIK